MFLGLNLRQLAAAVFFIISKLFVIGAIISLMSMIFFAGQNKTISLVCISIASFSIVTCIAICFWDIRKSNNERKNIVRKVLDDPETLELIKQKLNKIL